MFKPLNGTKTHPLSDKSMEILRSISRKSIPSSEVNPGVIDRLMRGGLVTIEDLTSPYITHKGGTCRHLVITEKGRELAEVNGTSCKKLEPDNS